MLTNASALPALFLAYLGACVLAQLVIALFTRVIRPLLRGKPKDGVADASRADVRFIAEHMGDVAISVAPGGAYRYVSPSAARLFGVPPAEILANGMQACVHPDDRHIEAALHHELLTGVSAEGHFEFRLDHPARGVIWVEARARRRWDPEGGEPDGFMAVLRDVTARKAIDEVAGRTDATYRLLAENTSDAATCMDLSLTHTYVSPAFSKMFGYKPEAVIGEPRARIVHPDDLAEVYRRLGHLVAGESEAELLTYRIRHCAGHFVWVESSYSLIREKQSGRPATIACSVRDVTERRAQADALQKANNELQDAATQLAVARDRAELASRTKSKFLANVSHEFRTPLNGLLGYTQILRADKRMASDQIGRLDAMLGAGKHLLDMINAVLDLSEIEAGKMELQLAATDLDQLVTGSADVLRPVAEARSLSLDVECGANLPATIIVDPTRLRQVLLNLLGNAVKFTTTGGVTVRVQEAAGRTLRFEIVDTGPGINRAQRDRLFKEFERLDARASGGAEGCGIGLALSARLVALMGGRIGHLDNAGGGSIFWFEVPLQIGTAQVQTDKTAVPPQAGVPVGRLSVLVVDDIAMNRDIAAAFLQDAGHQVALTEDGRTAVQMAASGNYDVILMDVRMPGMDGLEATARIRALTGRAGRVPIVGLTAQAFVEQVRACHEAGMDLHLAKPFTQAALLDILAHAVRPAGSLARPPQNTLSYTNAYQPDAKPPATPHTADAGILDHSIYHGTCRFLAPDDINRHLTTIMQSAAQLLAILPDSLANPSQLQNAGSQAHSLAGSAGIFGFQRLSTTALLFEKQILSAEPDLAPVVDKLMLDITAMLDSARLLVAAPVDA